MYTPANKELEDMGFTPRSWEGVIYGWDCNGLDYRTGEWIDRPPEEKGWTIGSWYCKLDIKTRQDVEFLLKLLIINKKEKGENE